LYGEGNNLHHRRKRLMLIGYARVSTPDQKLDLQLDALRQAGCERLFQDVMSSTRLDRPGLQAALPHLRPGDTFVIWKLDRLGRSVKGLITLTETLKTQGIAFVSLHDKIDTATALGEFFFHIMGAFARVSRTICAKFPFGAPGPLSMPTFSSPLHVGFVLKRSCKHSPQS
jgi:DNA invertase Pin-like site-specific DNA recombinase